jgi:hypothetical protein
VGKSAIALFQSVFTDSLAVKSVSIAVPSDSCNVNASTIRSLTFEKKNDFKIAPGADIYSDELNFNLKSNSFWLLRFLTKVTQSITGHPGSRTTSFIVKGEQSNVAAFKNPVKTDHWYSLFNIDVKTAKPSYAVAIMGNSITDGRGSGTNRQNRWPDIFLSGYWLIPTLAM